MVMDLKRTMRVQATREDPRGSLTADGESAHRALAVARQDWGLQVLHGGAERQSLCQQGGDLR